MFAYTAYHLTLYILSHRVKIVIKDSKILLKVVRF